MGSLCGLAALTGHGGQGLTALRCPFPISATISLQGTLAACLLPSTLSPTQVAGLRFSQGPLWVPAAQVTLAAPLV
jgi:hypothetical protein